MNGLASELIYGTLLMIIVFLVLKNATSFSDSVKTLSHGYASSVAALQGR